MKIRSPLSPMVADYMKKGYTLHKALSMVLFMTDGSRPKTTDILLDLEDMGVWKPGNN